MALGLPPNFILDASRYGGMTELEEAALTTGQGKALSGHRTERRKRMGIGLRTNRAHRFNAARTAFGMLVGTIRPLLRKPLEALNYAPGRGSVPSGKGGGL
jgi:hypothetical protein